jgi:hypothetical protein
LAGNYESKPTRGALQPPVNPQPQAFKDLQLPLHFWERSLIYDPPEPDIKTGEWKYRVEGYEPGDKWVAVVFSFKTPDRAFLITIFSMEARTRK